MIITWFPTNFHYDLESEFNKFEQRLKSAKNRFQLSAGLNLETLNEILSGTNHIWAAAQILQIHKSKIIINLKSGFEARGKAQHTIFSSASQITPQIIIISQKTVWSDEIISMSWRNLLCGKKWCEMYSLPRVGQLLFLNCKLKIWTRKTQIFTLSIDNVFLHNCRQWFFWSKKRLLSYQ